MPNSPAERDFMDWRDASAEWMLSQIGILLVQIRDCQETMLIEWRAQMERKNQR